MATRRTRARVFDEGGFSLIELVVVLLIIGILVAIALPAFLDRGRQGEDAEAKSHARNLMSIDETCYFEEKSYTQCQNTGQLGPTGLPLVNGAPAAGEVSVTPSGDDEYTIKAASRSGNEFLINRTAGGVPDRSCTAPGDAGCPSSGDW